MRNVTDKVQEKVSTGKLEIQAHISYLGEPSRGERKTLAIVYSYGGRVKSKEIEENETLVLPMK